MSEQSSYRSLVDLLQARSSSDTLIHFIAGHDDYQTCSYAQLYQRACARLAAFQSQGIKAGDHMIIQSSDNLLFLEGFWACLLGGIIAVPVSGGNSREQRLKLFRIGNTLDNAALYTDEANLQRVRSFAQQNALDADLAVFDQRCCLSDQPLDTQAVAQIANPAGDDAAFIQFSSGSTSAPKGIVLTHRNLLINTQSIIDGCEMTLRDQLLSWMPLTHDMGLIGFHLTPLKRNCAQALIPTDVFVRRPATWLTETQRLQATILCSPNFGFQHLLKSFKPERYGTLDLSSIRLMFNGAEPISVPLCERFMHSMAAFGLSSNAMYPVYGLAEASLAVTFPSLEERFQSVTVKRDSLSPGAPVQILAEGEEGASFVSVGAAVPPVQMSIRGEGNEPLADQITGKICIRGPNVTSGYYKQPELNAQLIDANGWLDTGDLGFQYQGNLYITGRAKDIIFVNGQNVYPHDLEEILVRENHVERGKLAISSLLPSGHDDTQAEEKLLVFVLHRGDIADLEPLARTITRTLGTEAGVSVSAVVATKRIPKTTSGKVQRFQLVRDYLEEGYPAIFPRSELESDADTDAQANSEASAQLTSAEQASLPTDAQLLAICNAHVTDMTVKLDDNLFDLGISSLTLAEIHAAIEDTWPGQVEITDLFDYPTVTELAAFLDSKSQ